MGDPDPVVRTQAATACLALAADKALPILENAAKGMFGRGQGETYEIWSAQNALMNWRTGKPVIWRSSDRCLLPLFDLGAPSYVRRSPRNSRAGAARA
jgi:hypothetical protein